MDDDTIQNCLNEINGAIDDLRVNKDRIQGEAPSDFKLMMFGAKDSRVLDFIFSTKLDVVIDKLFHKIMSGDYSDVERICDTVAKAMEALGLGEGAFKGPVSQHLMTNIMNSLNSGCYNTTKNNIRKAMTIVSNLKKQGRQIEDREVRKKYYQAVKSLKLTIRLTAKIYRNRAKIAKGLHCAINEGPIVVDCLDPMADSAMIDLNESASGAISVDFLVLPYEMGGRHTSVDLMSSKPTFAVIDGTNRRCGGSVSNVKVTGISAQRGQAHYDYGEGEVLPGESGTMMVSLDAVSAKPGDVIAIGFDRPKKKKYSPDMMYALYFGIKNGTREFPAGGVKLFFEPGMIFNDERKFMEFVEKDLSGCSSETRRLIKNDVDEFLAPSITIGGKTLSMLDIRQMNGDILCVVKKR
jgi:hypothetical protein